MKTIDSGASKRLYAALLVNFIVLGASMTLFGATVPRIIDSFAWDYVGTGLVLSANALGGFLATLACGALLRRVPVKRLLLPGLGLIIVGLVVFGRNPSVPANGFLYFLIGAGGGFAEVITNSVVIRLEKPGESRLMNLMHAGFCVGAIVGPLAAGLFARLEAPFTLVFAGAGIVQAAILVVLSFLAFPRLDVNIANRDAPSAAVSRASVFGRPLLWILALGMFLYVGVELTFSNWIAEFSARFRSFSTAGAASMVSLYWGGLLLGRLGLWLFYRGKRQARLLALLAVSSVVFFTATALIPDGYGLLTAAAIFLTGLAFSGCYPVIMSLVGLEFDGSTAAVGLCASAGGVGVLTIPLATGALGKALTLPEALLAVAGLDLLLAALSIGLAVRRTHTAQEQRP